jgi:O-antigen ligase
MQTTILQSHRRRRLVAIVALSTFVGAVSAALATGSIGLLPPKLRSSEPRAVAAAATHVLVDSKSPPILHRLEEDLVIDTLVAHSELLGRVMVNPPVLQHIARRAGVAPDRIAAEAPASFGPRALTEPLSEERASEIHSSEFPYRLEVQPRPESPIIDIYAQAPSTAEATRLANAAVLGLRDYLRGLASRQGFAQPEPLRLRQLGAAHGGVVNGGAPVALAILTFLLAFALSCAAAFALVRLREWRVAQRPVEVDPPVGSNGASAGEPPRPATRFEGLHARLSAVRAEAGAAGDWPRTTRVLPWMLAAFIAMLWLVPFDAIELTASLPIDLKFDRLVLPFFAGMWLLALAAGGKAAPRVRPTWIHAAVGALVACAFLSVILNARELNQTLEWELSLKGLPLLVSYVLLFVMAASVVRRTEVPAFLKYTLALAVLCALGMLWEYRFKQNLFYDWSDKLLPGAFSVDEAFAGATDDGGRRFLLGPGTIALETIAMLSMALPIALVGLMQVRHWRGRILYGLAACLLLAAMLATSRKSALVAPISVVLTLVYCRRRELLKLAPLALILVLFIQIAAPGAIRMTTSQFEPDQLGVATVNDRKVDYDAVRPDVWTHLIFGRGWDSYVPTGHRILDSEILHRLIEMGVLGLAAFLLMGLAVVFSARATIAARDPARAPYALVGAAAAVAFIVVSALFDVLSFPHAPYIFLYLAGFVAVIIERRPEPVEAEPDEPDEAKPERLHAVTEGRVRRDARARRPERHLAGRLR